MIPRLLLTAVLLTAAAPVAVAAESCVDNGVALQVLGSGGPELQGKRAGSSYLVWIDGKARALIDTGGGSALRFGESGAQMFDLDVLLYTHLHADHSSDLPALVKSSWFESRTRPLPIYGPPGNRFMPSTVTFVRDLFDGTRGVYRYLGDFVAPLGRNTYKLEPHDVREPPAKIGAARRGPQGAIPVFHNDRLQVQAVRVAHGPVPALAWRIETGGKILVVSGDTNGNDPALALLATGADLFVAHHAIAEDGRDEVARTLHMPPSVIGQIAQSAKVKHLILSHRMLRTIGQEDGTLAAIRKSYNGPVAFADDLSCFRP